MTLLALLVGVMQPSILGDMAPAVLSDTGAPMTSVGRRCPYFAQRKRRGVPHSPSAPYKLDVPVLEPVPLFVMLPLDTVDPHTNKLKDPKTLRAHLVELQRIGVEGVMCDVWWGIVEREGPGIYDWEAYTDLVEMVAEVGLKLQAVMSFHQCGGNIGDACTIPLPWWVLKVGDDYPDIWYTDAHLHRNREYISLGADNAPLFPLTMPGAEPESAAAAEPPAMRSPIDMYRDFMASFATTFAAYMPHIITEAQVSMRP
jgi:beta-amylase